MNSPSQNSPLFKNVWDAIENTPEAAQNIRLRAALMRALRSHLKASGLNLAESAQSLGVTQPRVSDLMRGKINLFGLDALVNMAAKAGLRVDFGVRQIE